MSGLINYKKTKIWSKIYIFGLNLIKKDFKSHETIPINVTGLYNVDYSKET